MHRLSFSGVYQFNKHYRPAVENAVKEVCQEKSVYCDYVDMRHGSNGDYFIFSTSGKKTPTEWVFPFDHRLKVKWKEQSIPFEEKIHSGGIQLHPYSPEDLRSVELPCDPVENMPDVHELSTDPDQLKPKPPWWKNILHIRR
jgi:hypothetical protein